MDQHNPLSLLRQLKGSPLSILIALHIVAQPVRAKWLSSVTGYSPNIITSALVLLREMNLVNCDASRSNWHLTDGAKQLPLTYALDKPDRINCDPSELSTPPPPPPIGKRIVTEGGEEETDRENCDPRETLLYGFGVGEPTLTTLLDMEHMTTEYVIAHVTKAIRDEDPINHLIQRLRSNDKQPRTNNHGHVFNCVCKVCDPYRYINCEKCFTYHPRHVPCEDE